MALIAFLESEKLKNIVWRLLLSVLPPRALSQDVFTNKGWEGGGGAGMLPWAHGWAWHCSHSLACITLTPAPCGERRWEGEAGGLQLWFNFYETLWNSSPFPGKEEVIL